ncbi:MAG: hypothetical protein ACREBC_29540, partial [Pyrinomonadaceae bacterium]
MNPLNLPAPIHEREGSTALAAPSAQPSFEISGEDIRPPRLKVCQDPKTQAASFGDVFVQDSTDDPNPTIIQENNVGGQGGVPIGDLTEPIRFYAHASR